MTDLSGRSQHDVEGWKKTFSELDTSGHGFLGVAELSRFIHGIYGFFPPEEDVKMILLEIRELERAGHVSMSEFPLFASRAKTYARYKLAKGINEAPMTARSHRHTAATMRPSRHGSRHQARGDRFDTPSATPAAPVYPEDSPPMAGTATSPPPPTPPPPPAAGVSPSGSPDLAPPADPFIAPPAEDTVIPVSPPPPIQEKEDSIDIVAVGTPPEVRKSQEPELPKSPPKSPEPELPKSPESETPKSPEPELPKSPEPEAAKPQEVPMSPPEVKSVSPPLPPPPVSAPTEPPVVAAVTTPTSPLGVSIPLGGSPADSVRRSGMRKKSSRSKIRVTDAPESPATATTHLRHSKHMSGSMGTSTPDLAAAAAAAAATKGPPSESAPSTTEGGSAEGSSSAKSAGSDTTGAPGNRGSVALTGTEGLDFFLQLSTMMGKQDADVGASDTDYYEARLQSEDVLADPLCRIPADDIAVQRFPRPTVLTREPRPAVPAALEPHVRLTLDSLYGDYRLVRRKYAQRRMRFPSEAPTEAPDEFEEARVPKLAQIFASEEAAHTGSDTLHPDWIKPITMEVDTENAKERGKNRDSLFKHFHFDRTYGNLEADLCNRTVPDSPGTASLGTKISLGVDYLYFALGDFEPFFGSIALYDATSRTKISETFYFDCNTTPTKGLLGITEPFSSTQRALFSLPSEKALQGMNVWAVLIVEKVLQGDLETFREPYYRAEASATGEPTKDCVKAQRAVQERIGEVCRRLGSYRQFFCCSAFEVVTEDGAILLDNPKLGFDTAKSGKAGPFLRTRVEDANDIYGVIAELREVVRKGKKLDAKKVIPGQWRAHVYDAATIALDSVCYDVMRRPVTPAMPVPFERFWEREASIGPPPVLPPPREGSRTHDAAFEMHSFPPSPEPIVARSFVNSIFVYPETINLSRERKKMNLCVTVYLRDSDAPLGDKENCLPCWIGRSGFSQSLMTSVIYHTKTATFLDEMKANLPFPLTPAHHLLFVIQNIPVDSDDKPEADALVWYTYLPLFQNGGCTESSTYPLLVNPGMPPNRYFTSGRDSGATAGTESQRLQIFRVRVAVASTVYPQDKVLSSFLTNALNPKSPPAAVLEALRTVTAIRREVGVQFFVPIVKALCVCACSDASTEVSMMSIKALIAFLYNLSPALQGQGPRYPLLAEFITYDHDNLQGVASVATTKEVFEGLAAAFASFLGMLQKTADGPDMEGQFSYEVIFGFAWFVFDMISKSIILTVADAGRLGDPRRHAWLSKEDRWDEFARNLKKLATSLGKHICTSVRRGDCKTAPDANASFALFLRDLLPVFHRGRVIETARAYLDQLLSKAAAEAAGERDRENGVISLMATDFLTILADYEHFVPLSVPIVSRVTTLDGLCDTLCRRHLFSGFVVREVFKLLGSKSQDTRVQALQILVDLLCKLEFDERYDSPEARSRIAVVFFPMVLLMIDDWRRMKEWQEKADVFEEQAMYAIFTHILKNINRDFLTQWWSGEVMSRLTIFLNFIGNSIRSFRWQPGTSRDTTSRAVIDSRRRLIKDFLASCNLIDGGPDSSSPAPVGSVKGTKAFLKDVEKTSPVPGRHQVGVGSMKMIRMLNSRTVSTMTFIKQPDGIGPPLSPGVAGRVRAGSGAMAGGQSTPTQSPSPVSFGSTGPVTPAVSDYHCKALSTEVGLVHLDIMEMLIATYHTEMLNKEHLLMSKVFSVMILFLQSNQSVRFHAHFFAALRSFIAKYRSLIFTADTTYCGDVCDELVRMCNFSNESIRAQATAALYLIAKHNYKEVMNIDRTKIHVTTALAKLSLQNTRMFERSLATMALYASHDFEHSPGVTQGRSLPHRRLESTMSSMVEEAESRRRQAVTEKLMRQVQQDGKAQMIEYRAQVLEEWAGAKLALLDSVKGEVESFQARHAVIEDLDASIAANNVVYEALLAEHAEVTDAPKGLAAKVARLQQKWASLRKSAAPLVTALQEEKPRRVAAAELARRHAALSTAVQDWLLERAPALMCSDGCIRASSQEDLLRTIGAALAESTAAFEEKMAELRKLEAELKGTERYSVAAGATTSKDIEEAFALFVQIGETHRAEVQKNLEAEELKKGLFAKYKAAKDKLGEHLGSPAAKAAMSSEQGLAAFCAEADKLAEDCIALHKAYESSATSIEKRWEHMKAVLRRGGDFASRVNQLRARDAARRAEAERRSAAERDEAAYASEVGELNKWVARVVEACTAPVATSREDEAKLLLDQNRELVEQVKAQQELKEKLLLREKELQQRLGGRKPFAPVSAHELQASWDRGIVLLQERRVSIQAEITKQRVHDDMRHEFAEKLTNMEKWLDTILKDQPENLLKIEAELFADMDQIRDQRTSLAEAKIPDIMRYAQTTVEAVEEKFRRVKIIIQKRQQEAEAAGQSQSSPPSPSLDPMSSPSATGSSPSPVPKRKTSGAAATAAVAAALVAGAQGQGQAAPASPPIGSPSLRTPTLMMPEKDRQKFFMRVRGSMKDSFMVFDTTRRGKFAQSIQELSAHLTKIIHDSQKLNRLKMEDLDSELVRELQYEISRGYTDTPDLHITWLLQLAAAHLSEKNIVEAGMCKVRVAKIIYDNIRDKLPVQVPVSQLAAIYPSLLSSTDEPKSETRTLSPVFSEKGFIDMMTSAIALLREADHFEFCVTLYGLVSPLLAFHHNNSELSALYLNVHRLFAEISAKDTARLLSAFFRVGFYGSSFEELNGAEFIYRQPPSVHLFDLSQSLKAKYSKKEEVEIVDSTRSAAELDMSKRYIQVTAVKPYFDPDEMAGRRTHFEKLTVVQRFFLESPFTKGSSKAHASDVTGQWKRKTILTAADTFPSILKRLRVTAKSTVELSPIENAIEGVRKRNADLSYEVAKLQVVAPGTPVNLAALQLILQGSVLLQVNGGLLELCQGFLSAEGRREWPEHVPTLCTEVQEFVFTCRRALDVNKEHVKQDQAAFHEQLEAGYTDLEKRVKVFLEPPAQP